MQKTLLVVGAGFGQVPAIKKAREMGVKVITVDKNPKAIGMELADISYDIDVLDKDGILEVAQIHSIDGIMTLQSDFGVPAVGFINDSLNLNGISLETALNCSDKMKCRLALREKGCTQPRFFFADNLSKATNAAEHFEYPFIIKVPESSGSRGVTRVNKAEDITDAFDEAIKYSDHNNVIIEEFIDGLEFGAQTFSIKGECKVILLHNDTISSPPQMIPIGHSFPFAVKNNVLINQALSDIKKAVEGIGIKDGPANIDLILDTKTKKVNVIEIGARIGATCLPELVEYHTGIDWVKESIKSALSIEPDLSAKKKEAVAALIIQSGKDGIYNGYTIDCKPEAYNVIEHEITAKPGDRVRKLRNGTDRIGKVIAYGSDTNNAENNAKRFLDNINIEVE